MPASRLPSKFVGRRAGNRQTPLVSDTLRRWDEPAAPLSLARPLAELPGLGPARVKALERLGLSTVGDLLTHYPRRYEDRRQFEGFPNAAGDRPVCVCGIVVATAARRLGGKRQMFEATLQEPERHALSSLLTIRWFNAWYVQKIFAHGQRVVVYGKPKAQGTKIVIDHPEFEIIENDGDEDALIHLQRITPVYATTEGLSQRALRSLIYRVLQAADLDAEPTPLPDGLDPLPRGAALRAIHFPADDAQKEDARRHLVLSEFFGLQMLIAARRTRTISRPGESHCGPGRLLERFHDSLPFGLTGAQFRCVREIRNDLAAARPMNRLLQGDVGAGKTLVALSAMLLAVEAGYQALLMAPTQILAEQHYLVFRRWLEPLGLRLALRTGQPARRNGGGGRAFSGRDGRKTATDGRNVAPERRKTATDGPSVAVFGASVAVLGGSVAVFGASVTVFGASVAVFGASVAVFGASVAVRRRFGRGFRTVGPAPFPSCRRAAGHPRRHARACCTRSTRRRAWGWWVIDEQHKFGVLQRAALSRGRKVAPDVLVMTATPIPRTLAITVYGDLDVSILDELPAGRGKIVTGVRARQQDARGGQFHPRTTRGRSAGVSRLPRSSRKATNSPPRQPRCVSSIGRTCSSRSVANCSTAGCAPRKRTP